MRNVMTSAISRWRSSNRDFLGQPPREGLDAFFKIVHEVPALWHRARVAFLRLLNWLVGHR